jgi:hypothetical protein
MSKGGSVKNIKLSLILFLAPAVTIYNSAIHANTCERLHEAIDRQSLNDVQALLSKHHANPHCLIYRISDMTGEEEYVSALQAAENELRMLKIEAGMRGPGVHADIKKAQDIVDALKTGLQPLKQLKKR